MPWSDNNGANGSGGGSGGGSNGGGGPWGQRPNRPRGPQRPGGNGGNNPPPDLEEILKRGQDRLKNVLPRGGSGGSGGSGLPKFTPALLGLIALGAVVLYAFGGFYRVEADEVAVELVFGDPKDEVLGEGLQFVFWPVETYEKVQINERRVVVGSGGNNRNQGLMLTGDQNIADVSFTVLYSIDNINNFLFEVADPEQIIAEVADSAMREVVGRRPVDDVYRDDRTAIQQEVRAIVQDTLNRYNAGVLIRDVELGNAAPPPEVSDAFEEVQRAEQDEDRVQEEANRERNRVLGAVRGEAAAIREEAAAYKNRIVQEAEGEAARFLSVYEEYARAPEVTRKRLFLETMEEVLADSNKVIVESGQGGQGVVPYLPLPELQNRQRGGVNASPTAATGASTNRGN